MDAALLMMQGGGRRDRSQVHWDTMRKAMKSSFAIRVRMRDQQMMYRDTQKEAEAHIIREYGPVSSVCVCAFVCAVRARETGLQGERDVHTGEPHGTPRAPSRTSRARRHPAVMHHQGRTCPEWRWRRWCSAVTGVMKGAGLDTATIPKPVYITGAGYRVAVPLVVCKAAVFAVSVSWQCRSDTHST